MNEIRKADIVSPERIFNRYVRGRTANVTRIEKFFADDDIRFVFIVDTDLDEHVAVKVTNNSFTTPQRISGWKQLIDLYNGCGIYAPRILWDLRGDLCSAYFEGDRKYIVYAEEVKRYKSAKECGIDYHAGPFFEDMVKACAKVARASIHLPAWSSAWCIYDTFCAEDETDDTYMWARRFCTTVSARMPQFESRARRIWDQFLSLYEKLRPAYQRLPKAFLQGDEGGDNALVDADGRFIGMLDFNLAGTETIINYLFRNFCRVYIRPDEFSRLNDEALLRSKEREMINYLNVVRKYYEFSDAERAAFPTYYQMVYPMECDLCQSFEKAVVGGDSAQVRLILDWIEYQQTRKDVSLPWRVGNADSARTPMTTMVNGGLL